MRRLLTSFFFALSPLTQAADIDIVGLRSYSEKILLETIAGRLEYIQKRDATPQRADDAAFLEESYLHTHGLPEALVEWSLPGGDNDDPGGFLDLLLFDFGGLGGCLGLGLRFGLGGPRGFLFGLLGGRPCPGLTEGKADDCGQGHRHHLLFQHLSLLLMNVNLRSHSLLFLNLYLHLLHHLNPSIY